jgi:signal transduction histidine kinase
MLAWFHRLRVSQKLMLISLVFIVPDSVLLTLFLTSINGHIRFANLERYGNEYQRPLEQLLEYLPAHRLLARRVGADLHASDATLQAIERRVDDAFVELEATNARIGEDLQFTNEGLAKRRREHFRVDTMKAEWLDLKAHITTLSASEREERYRHLQADVRTMITHAGDTSNLILDPDLDSYYLMDVTLLALPQMQDRLASVMAYDVFEPGHVISREERSQLAVYAALLKEADLDRVMTSTKTALNEDVNFYGRSESLQRNIPPALDEFAAVADEFIRMTLVLSQSDHALGTADAYRAAGERARRASFRLWNSIEKELDGLLAHRIEYFESQRTRSLILTAFAVLAALGLVTFITRSISAPLKRQATELQQSNLTLQAEMRERQKAEAALIDASRQAGMAEVATGVLHNVGNVLNSVNLGAAGVRERLGASRLSHLRKAMDLVEQHTDDLPAFLANDVRGKVLPAFLGKLTRHLEDENRQLLGDMEVLEEHIGHIKQIVSMQQSYARVFGVMETLRPQALIEDAIQLNADSLARHRVAIQRHFGSDRTVTADRHKVLQILVNLLRNAKQSVGEADPADRRVTVRLGDKGTGRVFISVTDTGVGISADNMTRIFRLGFTTKRDGHGFGLHSSALAARELHGELSVHSDGPGQGATFTLELPASDVRLALSA